MLTSDSFYTIFSSEKAFIYCSLIKANIILLKKKQENTSCQLTVQLIEVERFLKEKQTEYTLQKAKAIL